VNGLLIEEICSVSYNISSENMIFRNGLEVRNFDHNVKLFSLTSLGITLQVSHFLLDLTNRMQSVP